jgi:hypothetical protein
VTASYSIAPMSIIRQLWYCIKHYRSWIFEKMWSPLLLWGSAGEKGGGGVFISYWLNNLNAANSDPTSWKYGVVRGPHRCPKIPAPVAESHPLGLSTRH